MAVRFDAAEDRLYHIAALPDPSTTGLTIIGWWRLRADLERFTDYYRTSGASNSTIHTVGAGATGTGVNVFTISGSITDTYVNAVDEWFAMAVVDTGGSVTQYVRPEGGVTVSKSGSVLTAVPAQICVAGRSDVDDGEWLDGNAAYVRVFAGALTQAEIEAEWSSPSAVLTAWADWPLETHTDLTDHSGNGRDLTPVGVGPTTEPGPSLGGPVPLAGAAAAAASASGALSVTRAVTGSAAAAAVSAAPLNVARALAGSVPAASGAIAPLGVTRALSGALDSAAGLSGALSSSADVDFVCQDLSGQVSAVAYSGAVSAVAYSGVVAAVAYSGEDLAICGR